ncbi:hypothetical protein G3M83_05920 [Rouxiella badensis]|jgi:hypothetical protein|uniref:hypothetical protein n=1 Tax=Rouxiella badensis TaxID=1646377 RepID=UPI0013EF231F|nr:hypothetical protein [Rouxiella badensis]QII37263.1 hypothetical protein G3M83_05920 [Rouxiella badensis]
MKISTRTLLLPLCGIAALISVGSQAAESTDKAPQGAPMTQPQDEPPFHGEGMPHFPPMGMMMPPPPMHGFCHGGELFCASVDSDNPTDTLQKLNGVIPAATAGKHYEVRVSVVEVPDFPRHEHGPRDPQSNNGK